MVAGIVNSRSRSRLGSHRRAGSWGAAAGSWVHASGDDWPSGRRTGQPEDREQLSFSLVALAKPSLTSRTELAVWTVRNTRVDWAEMVHA